MFVHIAVSAVKALKTLKCNEAPKVVADFS